MTKRVGAKRYTPFIAQWEQAIRTRDGEFMQQNSGKLMEALVELQQDKWRLESLERKLKELQNGKLPHARIQIDIDGGDSFSGATSEQSECTVHKSALIAENKSLMAFLFCQRALRYMVFFCKVDPETRSDVFKILRRLHAKYWHFVQEDAGATTPEQQRNAWGGTPERPTSARESMELLLALLAYGGAHPASGLERYYKGSVPFATIFARAKREGLILSRQMTDAERQTYRRKWKVNAPRRGKLPLMWIRPKKEAAAAAIPPQVEAHSPLPPSSQ